MTKGPLAVIDIGSNSGRVVVFRLEGGLQTQILAGSRGSLRLVQDLDRTHRLSREAIARAFEALQDFRAIAQGAGAAGTFALATAAVRDAENGPAFIAAVRKKLGFDVRILSGEEEARYGFLGAVGGLPVANGVLFDLGGGSLQVTRFRRRRMRDTVSLPLGSLRLSDAFLRSDPPTAREIRRLLDHVEKQLRKVGFSALGPGEVLVGTGGTIRNLAKIDRQTRGYPVTRLHGYVLTRKRLRQIVELLAARRARKRTQVRGLNEDRGDSIVGGGLVISALAGLMEAPEIWVSGQGVREGLARSVVGEVIPPPATVRETSVAALAARFGGFQPEQARRRAALADALLDALERKPDSEIREALRHAAILLDIGRNVDFFDRHQHVADIVLATDLIGFTHRQVALVSAIARCAGDESVRAESYAPLLGPRDFLGVRRAAALLVLADDIEERCPDRAPLRIHCRTGRQVLVKVPALAGWRPRGVAQRFERAFGRPLVVARS